MGNPFDEYDAAKPYFKPATGTIYKLGFRSIEKVEIEVTEKKPDGTQEKKKVIAMKLMIDQMNGAGVDLEYTVSSVRLIKQLRTYFDEGMLFTRIFSLKSEGTGFATTYQLTALGEKGKAAKPSSPPLPPMQKSLGTAVKIMPKNPAWKEGIEVIGSDGNTYVIKDGVEITLPRDTADILIKRGSATYLGEVDFTQVG